MRVMVVVGTRPEAIKLAPVVFALRETPACTPLVCATGQHRQMLDQVLALFGIGVDADLNLMRPNQDLTDVTTGALTGLREVLRDLAPDAVLVQGDTTTAFAGALAAFYARVPVGHVEAGLRTHDLAAPYPEEGNRQLVTRITRWHFAPTAVSRGNLLAEGVPEARIHVTGNTVIDALFWMRARVREMSPDAFAGDIGPETLRAILAHAGPLVLVTSHRRENFGAGVASAFAAIAELARTHPDWLFVYPVHLNPQVKGPATAILSGLANVHLTAPVPYAPFVWLMDRARLILTDSGGVQEEAPSLGKPVLVMREVTERPEAVAAGTVRLVGTDGARIVAEVTQLLTDRAAYAAMAERSNPYGDGKAAPRIAAILAGLSGGGSG